MTFQQCYVAVEIMVLTGKHLKFSHFRTKEENVRGKSSTLSSCIFLTSFRSGEFPPPLILQRIFPLTCLRILRLHNGIKATRFFSEGVSSSPYNVLLCDRSFFPCFIVTIPLSVSLLH